MRSFGELRNRQRRMEIALCIRKDSLDTVGFGFQLEQRRTVGGRARRSCAAPVSGRASAVEQTCLCETERAGADCGDPPASPRSLPKEFDQARRRRFGAAAPNQCVEMRIVERLCRDADAHRGTNGPAGQGGIGHNLPQEAPQAFTQAVVDVSEY
jgi:hypothetical protein